MADRYAVVITKPCQEEKAARHLGRQGIEYFLPMFKRRKELKPLFPRYLFASIDQGFYKLSYTPGVQGLLSVGDVPAVICSKVVNMVKSLCDHRGVYIVDMSKFKRGQKVRTRNGPFANELGTVTRLSENGRIEVLMNILGRSTRVVLDEDDLIAA